MTGSEETENSFQPHSDADLAAILESQLAQMRAGLPAVRALTDAVMAPVWRDEPYDTPTEEMSEAEIVDVRSDSRNVAGTPMMFSASEMASLMRTRTPEVEAPLGTEQQLINVMAEIEARGLSMSLCDSLKETSDQPGRLSFDDLLLGPASDE